jgi:hypothetical protein
MGRDHNCSHSPAQEDLAPPARGEMIDIERFKAAARWLPSGVWFGIAIPDPVIQAQLKDCNGIFRIEGESLIPL